MNPGLRFLILSLAFIISSSLMGQGSFQEAYGYFFGLDLENARKSYTEVFEDEDADIEERVSSARRLGYIYWHFYDDLEKAREICTEALEIGVMQEYVYKNLIRFEQEAGNYDRASEIYRQALLDVEPGESMQAVDAAYAQMVLKEAGECILKGDETDSEKIESALLKIEELNNTSPGDLPAARTQLGLALILGRGESAYQAWNMYYYIPEDQEARGMLKEPQMTLRKILDNPEQGFPAGNDMEVLINKLARSGFYRFAYLLIKQHPDELNENEGRISDISHYYLYMQKSEAELFDHYKANMNIPEDSRQDIDPDIEEIEKRLWNELTWTNGKPHYSTRQFREEIYKRFGTMIYDGTFSGWKYYIGGHAIMDTTASIEQFGRSAEVQFIVLDMRFSNNYWGWFTDYMGFAGYANGSVIVNYREPEAYAPIDYWNRLTDEKKLNKWKERIRAMSISDDSLAASGSRAILHGIHNRIRMDIYSGILDSLRNEGFEGRQLRLKFYTEFNQILFESTLIHEGRHAIDFNTLSRRKVSDGTEMEYRAKLSEMQFAPYPKLEIDFTIDDTPHGLANEKILNSIKTWMDEHPDKIKGFDPDRPTLPQADLLTDHQLREIARSVEPFLN